MSLYDGLDIDGNPGTSNSSKADIAGWGSSLKLMETQKQLQEKKQLLQNVKRKPTATSLAPVVDLKGRKGEETAGHLRFNQITGRMERVSSIPMIGSPFIGSEAAVAFLGIVDEYDPLRPNDYEAYMKQRKEDRHRERDEDKWQREDDRDSRRRNRRDEDRDRDRRDERRRSDEDEDRRSSHSGDGSRTSRTRQIGWRTADGFGDDPPSSSRRRDREEDNGGGEFERRRRRRAEEDEEDEDRLKRGGGPGAAAKAAIAPPPSLMDLDVKPTEDFQGPLLNKPEAPGSKFGLAGSVASKIMARMGYKEGQGLGKQEQGMSIALQVEKTSRRGGKIIHEKDLHKSQDMSVPRAETSNANLLRNPSKVIVLRNMVGPGEVDEGLEGETAEECSKYGKVIKCVIFEIPDTTEDEAVRIFIEFERLESSIKAVVDLNGRYFGGRVVKGNFYNLDKFRRLDLGDTIE